MQKHRLVSWRSLGLAMVWAVWPVRPAAAQTPTTYQACYVPNLGALYLIGLPGLPTACLATSHVLISWTDGTGALRPGTTAAGDLSGTLPNPTVTRLQGTAVASAAPTLGQVLSHNGTAWAPGTNAVSGSASGDLSGTYPGPTVARLQGTAVTTTTPTTGQVLSYNGTAWAPAANSVIGPAGGDLGGSYPNPTVARLQGTAVAGTAPSNGQVLAYNGTAWAPAAATLADGSVTTAKLADSAVTAGKVAHGAVTLDVTLSDGGSVSVAAKSTVAVTTQCAYTAGYRGVSGGWAENGSTTGTYVIGSLVALVGTTATGWTLTFTNPGTVSASMHAWAVCARVQP